MCIKTNGCPSILWHYGFTATKECQMLKWQERRNIAQAGSLRRLTASPTWAANFMDHLNMGYSLLVIIFPKKLVIFGVSNFWANSCCHVGPFQRENGHQRPMANAVSSGNAQASTGILERAGSAGPKRGDHFRPKGFLKIWKQNLGFDRWSDDPAECTNKTKKTKASYSVSMPSKEIRMGWNAVVLPFSGLWLPTTLPTSLNSSWCDVASSSVWIS